MLTGKPYRYSESDLSIRELGIPLGKYSLLAKRASVGPYSSSPSSGSFLPFLANVDLYIGASGGFSTDFPHYCRLQLSLSPANRKLFLDPDNAEYSADARFFYTQPQRVVWVNATHVRCALTTFAGTQVGGGLIFLGRRCRQNESGPAVRLQDGCLIVRELGGVQWSGSDV